MAAMPRQDPFRLDGRVAAVVGAASGIGEAVAFACARQGARVACLDQDAEGAAAVAARIAAEAGSAEAMPLDIRDNQAVRAAFESLRERHGRLDVAVCTPSINVRKPILAYTEDELERVLAVNLKGTFNVLQAAGRIMTAQGRGSIVLFSSIRSLVTEPGQSVYAATKAGIVQLVRTAAAEFGPAGVRVNAVAPGVVDGPDQGPAGVVRRLREQERARALGAARGDRGADGVPLLRRRQLRHRRRAVRGRRLDRRRRPLPAAGHVDTLTGSGAGAGGAPRTSPEPR
jgi:NAD(P)-dependent dehydrogenase (short-subunit alcohol dehydrogenase family)